MQHCLRRGAFIATAVSVIVFAVHVPTSAPVESPSGNGWAVLIGVTHYDDSTVPPRQFGVADAESIYNVLTANAGFKTDHVLLLTDRASQKPTLDNIKWALGTFLSRAAKDDLVIIYFAGRGARGDGPSAPQVRYLLPSDTNRNSLASTALEAGQLHRLLARMPADRVVVFIDADYFGAAQGLASGIKPPGAESTGASSESAMRPLTRAVVAASQSTQTSLERDDLGHGVFTHFVATGLNGAGDLNRDGIVTLEELYEYVAAQVTRKARAAGVAQQPVMYGVTRGPVSLLRILPAPKEQLAKAGVVTSVQGSALVMRRLLAPLASLRPNDTVFFGDRITSDAASTIRVLLTHKAVVTIRPRSTLTIGEGRGRPQLTVESGSITYVIDRIRSNNEVHEIHTPNAIARIHGAAAVITVTRETGTPVTDVTQICAVRGTVAAETSGRVAVDVSTDRCVTISGDVIGPTGPIPPKLRDELTIGQLRE